MTATMGKTLPSFLIPETTEQANGESAPLPLGAAAGGIVSLTLGITRIIEQESLDVSIWASADGNDWGEKPVAAFPQKFYCGAYSILVDLSQHPNAAYLKATWTMSRWGRGAPKPLFGFYVFAEPAGGEAAGAARA